MPFLESSPLNYPANTFSAIKRFKLNRAPNSGDYKNFDLGDEWLDTSSDDWWKLCDIGISSGTWRKIGGTSAASEKFIVDSGTSPVEPDATNQITITGGSLVETVGSLNTITINSSGMGFFLPDTGTTPVVPNASNQVTFTGGNGIQTTGGLNTVTWDMQTPFIGDFEFRSTTSGDTETLLISNTSNTAGSQAEVQIQVAGSTADDVWTNYSINGVQEYSVGIDNSDDKLKITDGARPSAGTDWFILDPTGASAEGQIDLPIGRLNVQKSINGSDININIENLANAPNSNAYLSIETGGSTGDPFVRYNITDSWAAGVDNSDTNAYKITYNASDATPSTGSEFFKIATTGDITFNNAYTFPITDGSAGQVLQTDGAGNVDWQTEHSTGEIVQYLNTSTSALVACNTQLPDDNSIPQQTEGNQVLTLAITPTSATNKLIIRFNSGGALDTTGSLTLIRATLALFQDATANALAALTGGGFFNVGPGVADTAANFGLIHTMVAGTTSPTTFKIRVGPSTPSGTININGNNAAAQVFGGVASTTLEIWEIQV